MKRRVRRWLLSLALPLAAFGCTPQQAQTAVDIATDVVKIATVLCLHDQAALHQVAPKDAAAFCATEQALAPYLALASKTGPKLSACVAP